MKIILGVVASGLILAGLWALAATHEEMYSDSKDSHD